MVRFAPLLSQMLTMAILASVALAAATGRRSASFDDHGAELYMDERGEMDGDIFDERGALLTNPRINLVPRGEQKRQQPGFNYGSTKVRGVNIGGWLVAEPWITPSLFDNTGDSRVVDEWTYGQYVPNALSNLQAHWSSFITEDDFAQIAAAGLNHVRIPIGYWAIDRSSKTKEVQGNQYDYLKQAVGWARNHGLKVVIDLHGAPGSQNGFDNSGRRGAIKWMSQEAYKTRARNVVRRFARDFLSQTDVVTAIELLNEPLTTSGPSNALSFTRDYYNKGYAAVRVPRSSNKVRSNFAVMVHDGFQPLSYWNGAFPSSQYQQVLLDTHIYSVFNNQQIAMSNNDRLQYYCNMKGSIGSSQNNLWTICGEWTTAPTDCAKYLNGRGVGSRYDGSYPGSPSQGSCSAKTGDGSNFSSDYKSFLKQMFDTQRSVYEVGSGWMYWTWKTEQAADWDYQRGLAGGWITNNLNSFSSSYCP